LTSSHYFSLGAGVEKEIKAKMGRSKTKLAKFILNAFWTAKILIAMVGREKGCEKILNQTCPIDEVNPSVKPTH
jgi:hypothetical protein